MIKKIRNPKRVTLRGIPGLSMISTRKIKKCIPLSPIMILLEPSAGKSGTEKRRLGATLTPSYLSSQGIKKRTRLVNPKNFSKPKKILTLNIFVRLQIFSTQRSGLGVWLRLCRGLGLSVGLKNFEMLINPLTLI